jgi:hypothetical protein
MYVGRLKHRGEVFFVRLGSVDAGGSEDGQ